MPKKLSDSVIAERMVELRNLRQAYTRDRQQILELKLENKQLRHLVDEQQTTIETLKIQIAELQTMVFGKKKRPPTGTPVVSLFNTPTKQLRAKASYRRPISPTSAITSEVVTPITDVCACGGHFKITTHERYKEDIPLPNLTKDYVSHLVTKYVISRGICSKCGKAHSNKALGGQTVTLGPNIRLLMAHLASVLGLSYQQIASLILSLYGIVVSDGEIANILHKQHQTWLPAYEQLKADIRCSSVVHVDETPWPIQTNDGLGYAWVLSDSANSKVCYSLEDSRGAVHARNLFGENTKRPFTGIRISDDYNAYRALPGKQQLCWAHLYRCIRDLRYNDNLPETQLPSVYLWYEQFANIYQDLRLYLNEPYDKITRQAQTVKLWRKLRILARQQIPAVGEPHKLTRLKAQLIRVGQDRLFTCLIYDTPCDNNRAERDLRQLVLKRKRSFGSQTAKGAKALSTVLSICTTTWRSHPTGYFEALARLG